MYGRKVLINELIENGLAFIVEYDILDGTYTAQIVDPSDYFCVFETVYEAESLIDALWLSRVLTPHSLPEQFQSVLA